MTNPGRRRQAALTFHCALVVALVATLALVSVLAQLVSPSATAARTAGSEASVETVPEASPKAEKKIGEPARLPSGKRRIFPHSRLVAYYGTAGTGVLGVLGEADPDAITKRLRRAARPFATKDRDIQPVYELIVTIADASPGEDGDYNHDITRRQVQTYIDAAHRNKTLLVLDLQPGRRDFLKVAKRWEWALRDPWVGLALDPEWRMKPGQVPGQVLGSVSVEEVNRVGWWLNSVAEKHALPQKVFMLHTFRTSMIPDAERVKPRDNLALVQHVDGFGTPGQKLDTYHHVARPGRFHMGFKLFYDEDRPLMSARRVLQIRPKVEFISFQ